jgi:hypothetical protein
VYCAAFSACNVNALFVCMQHFILAVTKHLPSRTGSSSSSSTTADATDASAMETDSLLQSTDEQPSAYSIESEV